MQEKEVIKNICQEIWELKGKSIIIFNDYFEKYNIEEKDKLNIYNEIMKEMQGWISVAKRYKGEVVGLPFNIPHYKNKKFVHHQNPVNLYEIKSIIEVVESGKAYKKVSGKKLGENSFSLGYVEYDERIFKLFRCMPFYEKDYNKNIEKIMKKDISLLSMKETQQYITYIYRKEKFIEGIVAEYIENGILLQLLKHFLDLQ